MSQLTYYKCEGCGEIISAADNTWTRHLGSFSGMPSLAAPSPFPQAAVNGVRPVTIDLCANCAGKTTVAQLVAITTALTPKSATVSAKPANAPIAAPTVATAVK